MPCIPAGNNVLGSIQSNVIFPLNRLNNQCFGQQWTEIVQTIFKILRKLIILSTNKEVFQEAAHPMACHLYHLKARFLLITKV